MRRNLLKNCVNGTEPVPNSISKESEFYKMAFVFLRALRAVRDGVAYNSN